MFFLPLMISNYFNKGLSFLSLLKKLREKINPSICFAYYQIFLIIRDVRKFYFFEIIELRFASSRQYRLLDNNYNPGKEDEKSMCRNVTEELLNYRPAENQVLLSINNDSNIRSNTSIISFDRLAHLFICDISYLSYSMSFETLKNYLSEGEKYIFNLSCSGDRWEEKNSSASLPELDLPYFIDENVSNKTLIRRYSRGCRDAEIKVSDYTKRYVFGAATCKCCSEMNAYKSSCMNTILGDLQDELDDIRFDPLINKYSREVILWSDVAVQIQNIIKKHLIMPYKNEDIEDFLEICEKSLNWLISDYQKLKQNLLGYFQEIGHIFASEKSTALSA